jgi:hypothetical protein
MVTYKQQITVVNLDMSLQIVVGVELLSTDYTFEHRGSMFPHVSIQVALVRKFSWVVIKLVD